MTITYLRDGIAGYCTTNTNKSCAWRQLDFSGFSLRTEQDEVINAFKVAYRRVTLEFYDVSNGVGCFEWGPPGLRPSFLITYSTGPRQQRKVSTTATVWWKLFVSTQETEEIHFGLFVVDYWTLRYCIS